MPIVDDDGAADRRDDRARARPPLHPRGAHDLDPASTPRPPSRRSSACSTASCIERRGATVSRAASGSTRSTPTRSDSRISEGDVVVVGNRADAQRQSIELGAALLVTSNNVRARATRSSNWPREHGLPWSSQPARLLRLEPDDHPRRALRALADREPLTVGRDDLVSDDLRAGQGRPLPSRRRRSTPSAARSGCVTRSDLVSPRPRRVLLVDHAEQAQSVQGVEQARDRRDPRPPPHRLDRDQGSR